MSDSSNKVSRFWQELKRRNVLRSLAIYAGSAFIILEAATIIFPRWGFPDWTIDLVLYLLILGAFINIVVAWIFDFTPEGVQKTKPIAEVQESDKSTDSNAWRVATYISLAVIVGLIVLNIIPRSSLSRGKALLDKSIAVLPFTYLSDEPDKQYLADGSMDEIILNLSKINDLRVLSKTSMEQYRNSNKPITKISEELNVAFLLEGSFLKSGNQVRLIVKLIEPGKEGHVWAKNYDRNWQDIFAVQSEVAQLVAKEINAIITPEEKQLIEKIPTQDLTAYDFYQRGRALHENYWSGSRNKEDYERAEVFYHKALEYDSTFARAYVGLGWVYRSKSQWDNFFDENYLDSLLIIADKALSLDNQLSEAYELRGKYYQVHGNRELAIIEFEKAIDANPSDGLVYTSIGSLYWHDDNLKSIENYHKALSLHRGYYLASIYGSLITQYGVTGFKERAIYYAKERLKLNDDSASYYLSLAQNEEFECNFEKAIEFSEKSYAIDSTRTGVIFNLGLYHSFLGQFEESLKYMKKIDNILKARDSPDPETFYRIGYAYWVNGFKEEGKYYINTSLEQINELIDLGRWDDYFLTPYHLAAIYAFLGEKDKAYENLRLVDQKQRIPIYIVANLKGDPMFDSIRDEPEFQQIVQDIETKYQAEHERVRQWLEENEML